MVQILPAVGSDFENEKLIQRVRTVAGADADVLLFRVFEGREECGVIALRRDDEETIELEEMFLTVEFRGRGLGARIMEDVVEICRALGYRRITVWAHPLDDAADEDDAKVRLIEWYKRCGFSCSGAAWDELERTI